MAFALVLGACGGVVNENTDGRAESLSPCEVDEDCTAPCFVAACMPDSDAADERGCVGEYFPAGTPCEGGTCERMEGGVHECR